MSEATIDLGAYVQGAVGHGIAEEVQTLVDKIEEIDYRPVLRKVSKDLENDHAFFFANEVAASGDPWAELADATIFAKGHDIRLFETGALRESLTAEGGDGVRSIDAIDTAQWLVWGTMDAKAHYHMTGTSRMPARPPVGFTDYRREQIEKDVADFAIAAILGEF